MQRLWRLVVFALALHAGAAGAQAPERDPLVVLRERLRLAEAERDLAHVRLEHKTLLDQLQAAAVPRLIEIFARRGRRCAVFRAAGDSLQVCAGDVLDDNWRVVAVGRDAVQIEDSGGRRRTVGFTIGAPESP